MTLRSFFRRPIVIGGLVCLVFAALAFNRRWMSDDGLIFTRAVRQILDGNGPVFNAFERAESGTSTLWTYLLVAFSAISRRNPAYVAVYAGLVFAVASIGIGMAASARLYRGRDLLLLPGGVLVVLCVFPFWDFATSGLETGLAFAWLAGCWWLLVTLRSSRLLVTSIVFGLGPLVRPDFGIVSIVMYAAAWLLERPSWKRTLVLGAAGIALPLAYEIFRMGYYGTLVPLPALAKSATDAEWARGWLYLLDYVRPYWLWLPFALLVALGVTVIRRHPIATRERILVAAPVISGLLSMIYVLRVGGDFMHARMFLPATFLLLLPAFMLPWSRLTAPIVGLTVVWGIFVVATTADGEMHVSAKYIEDERVGYVRWTQRRNPIDPKVFYNADKPASGNARIVARYNRRIVLSEDTLLYFPMSHRYPGSVIFVVGRLGTGGVVLPLDEIVVDTLGLANPLGARITPTLPEYPGHEKPLPIAWIVADYGADDATTKGVHPLAVNAARRAMKCGALAELLESVRAPLTASRFWANLTGSFARTRLVIPSDPVLAEQKFCGDKAEGIAVLASTPYEFEGWGLLAAIDGVREPNKDWLGIFVGGPKRQPEWIELRFPKPRRVSKVVLTPSWDAFPIDFKIQIWDGARWVDRVTQTAYPVPSTPQTFSWTQPDVTTRVRLLATQLAARGAGFALQLNEIEVGE